MKFAKHTQGTCEGCLQRLLEGHAEIQRFFHWLKENHSDAHTSWVYRGPDDQEKARSTGASNARFGQSKHNSLPARAIDIFQIDVNGVAIFDRKWCLELNEQAKAAGFRLKWGGEFKSLGDYGHWEIS
jgi:D-alanyl-D-alanine carboxypeptidase